MEQGQSAREGDDWDESQMSGVEKEIACPKTTADPRMAGGMNQIWQTGRCLLILVWWWWCGGGVGWGLF